MNRLIDEHVDQYFRLRISILKDLNRAAVEGLMKEPGALRQEPMSIRGSGHTPPRCEEVQRHLEELCDYVNENWDKGAFHLAAYVMWRLNWIHPFRDGNGRTSRAASYLVLCVRLGKSPPGNVTVPQRIKKDMAPYYAALEAADEAWKRHEVDVSQMAKLLDALVMEQVRDAGSNTRSSLPMRNSSPGASLAPAVAPNTDRFYKNKLFWTAAGVVVAAAGVLVRLLM